MRITLINPRGGDLNRSNPPLGLGYIASVLRKNGHTVQVIDCDVRERGVFLSIDKITKRVLEFDSELVGITATINSILSGLEIAKSIKKVQNVIPVIMGGHQPTFSYKELLKQYNWVDVVVLGEGELTMLELVEKRLEELDTIKGISFKRGNDIIKTPPRALIEDLDSLPFPARDLFPPLDKYNSFVFQKKRGITRAGFHIRTITSRGCPYACSFCSVSSFYKLSPGRKYRVRSVNNVVDEIKNLVEEYNISFVHFSDDNFFVLPKRAVQIAQELEDRDLDIAFTFATRPDQVCQNERFIKMLAKNCFGVEIGIENGCNQVLVRYNKGLTVNENECALKILRSAGIPEIIGYIMFNSQTTLEELIDNCLFLERNNLIDEPHVIYSKLVPYPGTPVYDKLKRSGHLKENFTWKLEELPIDKIILDERCVPDYDFIDPEVKLIYTFLTNFRDQMEANAKKVLEKLKVIERLIMQIEKEDMLQINESLRMKLTMIHERCSFERRLIDMIHFFFFKKFLNTKAMERKQYYYKELEKTHSLIDKASLISDQLDSELAHIRKELNYSLL